MQDLTTGSITRHLLKTASFMLVTMVFQTLYFLVDLYWVGRLGKEAVAAVGIAGNLTFIVLAISQMLGVGTTTLVSHAAGRKDHERALLVFNQSQVLSVLVGGIFLIVSMALRGSYAASLGADPQTARQAEEYLTWFIPAMALQFAMVAMGSALRGTGNFKPGMIVADRDRHPQHGAGAVSDLRLGDGRASWRRGRGDLVAGRGRGWSRLAGDVLREAWCVPAFRAVADGFHRHRSGLRCSRLACRPAPSSR